MKFESYEHLLEDIKKNGVNSKSNILLQIQDWFISSFKFDPVSSEPLATNFDFLTRHMPEGDKYTGKFWPKDRFQNIVDFSSTAILSLMDALHEKNIREHSVSHVKNIRETDSASIRYLSKKPGRTIKQKIAYDKKMLGVFHNTTLDTGENRLFKAFIQRLDELLYCKEEAFGYDSLSEDQQYFNNRVHRWLNSDEASLIGSWTNLPPNNTLLNDKNYRKIWKSWNKLQMLDETVQKDGTMIDKKLKLILLWELAKKLNQSSEIQLYQQPVKLDFDSLEILLERNPIQGFYKEINNYQDLRLEIQNKEIVLFLNDKRIDLATDKLNTFKDIISTVETICSRYFPNLNYKKYNDGFVKGDCVAIDLSSSKPFFSTPKKSGRFPFNLINQIWNVNTKVCVPGFYSKLLQNNKKITNYSIKTFYSDKSVKNIDEIISTAEVFADKISSYLNAVKCIYIVPDHFDDFSPVQRCLRNSLNSHFLEAVPMPKSIAAVFAETKKQKIASGTEIYVIDKYDNYWIVTKVVACLEKELLDKNPRSNGIVFERYPAEILSKEDFKTQFKGMESFIPELFSKKECELLQDNFSIGNYHFSAETVKKFNIPDFSSELNKLTQKKESNKKIYRLEIKDNISKGALLLEELQRETPDIPLWKDHLPPLYIEVDHDGIGKKKIDLVKKSHGAIQLKRGVSIPIEIPVRDFILPAGKNYYEFPLVQGDNKKGKQSYFALLENDNFPLKQDTPCELFLTYTYGNECPYELKFKPSAREAEIKTVTVQWMDNSKQNWKDELPVPRFPEELTWDDMLHFESKNGSTNLLDDIVIPEVNKIDDVRCYKVININRANQEQEYDLVFLDFVGPNNRNPICYVDKKRNIQKGDSLYCVLKDAKRGLKGVEYWEISPLLKFAILSIWNNGHSLQDVELTSDNFRTKMQKAIEYANNLAFYEYEINAKSKNDMKEFLCMLHKDMPIKMADDLLMYYDSFPTRCIGNAIGDCSLDWQKELWNKVLTDSYEGKRLGILSKCLWRSKDLVYLLPKETVKQILADISRLLSKFDLGHKLAAINLAADLETLIALLRLRSDLNGKQNYDEEMLKLLSIHQNPDMKNILTSLRKLNKRIIEQNFDVYSRLNFDIDKSITNNSPDLVFAAMTYISGNKDSNSIRVKSVIDEE